MSSTPSSDDWIPLDQYIQQNGSKKKVLQGIANKSIEIKIVNNFGTDVIFASKRSIENHLKHKPQPLTENPSVAALAGAAAGAFFAKVGEGEEVLKIFNFKDLCSHLNMMTIEEYRSKYHKSPHKNIEFSNSLDLEYPNAYIKIIRTRYDYLSGKQKFFREKLYDKQLSGYYRYAFYKLSKYKLFWAESIWRCKTIEKIYSSYPVDQFRCGCLNEMMYGISHSEIKMSLSDIIHISTCIQSKMINEHVHDADINFGMNNFISDVF